MQEKGDDVKLKLTYDKLLPIIKKSKDTAVILPSLPANLVLIFSRHRHYRHLVIELVNAEQTKQGKLKNPFQVVEPLDLMWKTEDQQQLKFFAAVSKFKNHYQESQAISDIEALKAIVANPLKLPVYLHDEKVSATISASSLIKIDLASLTPEFELNVDERTDLFALEGTLHLDGKSFPLEGV